MAQARARGLPGQRRDLLRGEGGPGPPPPRPPVPSRVCLPTPVSFQPPPCLCGASAPRWPRRAPLLRHWTPTSEPSPGLPRPHRWSRPGPCPSQAWVPTCPLQQWLWRGGSRQHRETANTGVAPATEQTAGPEPEHPLWGCPGFSGSHPAPGHAPGRPGPFLTHRPLSPAPSRSLGSGQLGATQTEPSAPQAPCCRPCLELGSPPKGPERQERPPQQCAQPRVPGPDRVAALRPLLAPGDPVRPHVGLIRSSYGGEKNAGI